MRYACFPGGKRIRPVLTLAAVRLAGGKEKDALPAACAVELIHNYSLIHDDLPALDDDDRRRGKPSCHKKFGEAVALLAGDALLTLSFRILSTELKKNFGPKSCLDVIAELAAAAGTAGMVGGQVAELVIPEPDLAALEYVHSRKTGRLIRAAVKTGALLGGAKGSGLRSFELFGEKLGFMFQVVDDILDGDGVVRFLGRKKAREWAARLAEEAKAEIAGFGKRARILKEMTDAVSGRKK
jgi:geranylgeranyl diphosphate synthase type II